MMRNLFEDDQPTARSAAEPAREPDPDEDFEDLLKAIHVIRVRYLTEEKKSVAKALFHKLAANVELLRKDMERFQ
jgi:hypothetical protein